MANSVNRIMVVDGSTVSREIVTRILANELEEAEITGCATGTEAMEALSRQHYDLITTSLMLPDMDGLDLCRRLRRSSQHHYTPLVVISGDADDRLLKEGFAAGVTDYFDKSQGYPAFGQFIRDFCQRNSGLVGRILYVEDSRTAATMTLRMLEKHGLRITHVTSAEAALERIQRLREEGDDEENGFDIVVSDFHLRNEMTGGDLLHAIRTRYQFSHQELPLLMITGNDSVRAQIEAFHAGANDFVSKPLVEEIIMARLRSLLLIKQQYDALQRQAKKMEKVASTDSLTGVYNRYYLREHGDAMLKNAAGRPFWTMIIDIDHFKQINDNQGHMIGDHVLAAMGDLLNRYFADGAVVRFGGEEFAVLLPLIPRQDAIRRAESLRQATEDLEPDGVKFTVSIGVAGSEDHPGTDLNGLIGLADKALYESKRQGRNRVSHTPSSGVPTPLNGA